MYNICMCISIHLYIYFIHNNMGFLYVDAANVQSSLENKQVRKPNRTVDDLEQLCLWQRTFSTRLPLEPPALRACVLRFSASFCCVRRGKNIKRQCRIVLKRRPEAAAVCQLPARPMPIDLRSVRRSINWRPVANDTTRHNITRTRQGASAGAWGRQRDAYMAHIPCTPPPSHTLWHAA